MKLRLSLPLFSSCTLSAMMLYGMYVAVQPRCITYSCDGNFSSQLLNVCRSSITPHAMRKQTKHDFLKGLKALIPGLESCSIRYNGFQKAHVTLKGQQPFIVLNATTVLSTRGTMMSAADVQAEVVERLPHIQVNDSLITRPETVQQLCQYMQALPADLFEQSRIVWHDKTAIYLIDRAEPQNSIVAHQATRFTPELLAAVAQIRQQRAEEVQKKNRGTQKKIIDVRVKGQIIIRQMQGGEYESIGEKYHHSH